MMNRFEPLELDKSKSVSLTTSPLCSNIKRKSSDYPITAKENYNVNNFVDEFTIKDNVKEGEEEHHFIESVKQLNNLKDYQDERILNQKNYKLEDMTNSPVMKFKSSIPKRLNIKNNKKEENNSKSFSKSSKDLINF